MQHDASILLFLTAYSLVLSFFSLSKNSSELVVSLYTIGLKISLTVKTAYFQAVQKEFLEGTMFGAENSSAQQ